MRKIEAAKFETETTIEINIDEIKSDHTKKLTPLIWKYHPSNQKIPFHLLNTHQKIVTYGKHRKHSNRQFNLLKIQLFIHQQHQNQISNCILDLPSTRIQPSGDLVDFAIGARFYPPPGCNHQNILILNKLYVTIICQINSHKRHEVKN